MAIWSSVVFVVTSIGVITASLFLILAIPRSARAGYRMELWGVRDQLVDELASGAIAPSAGATQLLNVIERHIKDSDTFVAWRIIAFLIQRRGHRPPADPLKNAPNGGRLREIEREVLSISARAIVRTSWLGRIWLVWVPIVARVTDLPEYFVVPDDTDDSTMKNSVRTVLEMEFATQTPPIPSRELAHCV